MCAVLVCAQRALEKSLLDALNESEGNLLDNDAVLATLERLKHDAADVAEKAADADNVMAELSATSAQYAPFARACSSIYFALEELAHVHYLYQFSLAFFFDLFNDLLNGRVAADGGELPSGSKPLLDGVADHQARLDQLGQALFRVAFRRTSRSLLHEDYATFGMRLAQIALELRGAALRRDELDFLLRGGEASGIDDAAAAGNATARLLGELAALDSWKAAASALSSTSAPPLADYVNAETSDAATGLPDSVSCRFLFGLYIVYYTFCLKNKMLFVCLCMCLFLCVCLCVHVC